MSIVKNNSDSEINVDSNSFQMNKEKKNDEKLIKKILKSKRKNRFTIFVIVGVVLLIILTMVENMLTTKTKKGQIYKVDYNAKLYQDTYDYIYLTIYNWGEIFDLEKTNIDKMYEIKEIVEEYLDKNYELNKWHIKDVKREEKERNKEEISSLNDDGLEKNKKIIVKFMLESEEEVEKDTKLFVQVKIDDYKTITFNYKGREKVYDVLLKSYIKE